MVFAAHGTLQPHRHERSVSSPSPPFRMEERAGERRRVVACEPSNSATCLPEHLQRDEDRARFVAAEGVEELRFWNHQWRKNREAVLLEIWEVLHRRTGCVQVMRKEQNQRFVPPKPEQLLEKPAQPPVCRPRQ